MLKGIINFTCRTSTMGLKNACYLIIEFVHVRGLTTSNNEFLDVESPKLVKLTKTY